MGYDLGDVMGSKFDKDTLLGELAACKKIVNKE
jgi:hypothetical protein